MKLVAKRLNSDNVGLAWKFHVSPASCNSPEYYENYIRLCASSDYIAGMGVTHLLVDEDNGGALAGYITLRSTSLCGSEKSVHPAIEIAELAVCSEYERKGVGTALLEVAFKLIEDLRRDSIGIKYVLVCSDPASVDFYKKFEFSELVSVYEILRDGWNNNCTPLFMRLPEQDFG